MGLSKNRAINDLMICPKCGSDEWDSIDETVFSNDKDKHGFYNANCTCRNCCCKFKIRALFKYTLLDINIKEVKEVTA